MKTQEQVRIDKWLWAVRIFKSRTKSNTQCKSGKVFLGKRALKPSHLIQPGDRVQVHKSGFILTFEVIRCIDKRVSAPIALSCYRDHTPPEEYAKYDNWFIGKSRGERRDRGTGRPTKKERRTLDRFKKNRFDSD